MRVDLIVENAQIHTGVAGAPVLDRLAVLDGTIVATGADVDGLSADERTDVGGRPVLAGFNDAHAHSVWFGLTLLELDLSSVTSPDDVYGLVAEEATRTGADDWIIAAGYNPVHFGGVNPERDRLDRAAGGRPVWIKHASGHSCLVNGAALRRIGVGDHDDGTSITGGAVVRDAGGRPTGVLEEKAMTLVQEVMLPYPVETIERALALASAHYLTEGITSVTDAGVAAGWIGHSPLELLAYQRAREAGTLATRMQPMPMIDALSTMNGHPSEADMSGFGAGLRTGFGDEWLQVGPAKVFTDGSVLGRTAYMTDHYDGCPGHHGYLQAEPADLRRQVLHAYAGGWSLAMHAVGDAGLDVALDLFEEAIDTFGRYRIPNRVEHGTVVRPDQVERLARLGVACVGQPRFIPTFGEGMRGAIGEGRSHWSHRARSFLDAGLPLAMSSDRPVAAGAPLAGIQAWVERLTETGDDYGPGERITVEDAIASATSGSAAVTGWAHRKGTLARGMLADMVVLDEHPGRVSTADIHAVPVVATIVGGQLRYRSDAF